MRTIFIHLAALLLAAALWSPAPAADQKAPPPAPVKPVVRDLVLKGFTDVPEEAARKLMETKGPQLVSLQALPRFDPQALERDLERLKLLFQEHGFFEAKLTHGLKRSANGREVSITIQAVQGRPTMVSRLVMEFSDEDHRAQWEELLRKQVPIRIGQRFSLDRYEEGKSNIRAFLANDAHPMSKVAGQVRVYRSQYKAEIVYRVSTGPRLLFGTNQVVNNRRITKPQVLRETTYARGQPFDLQALQATERALLSTGFFDSVSLKPEYDHIDGDQVPITIEVFESKPHSLKLSLGYGTWDEYRLGLSLINRSIFGLGETLTFEGKISHIYRGLTGRFELPHFFHRWTKLIIYGGQEQRDDEAYTNRRLFLRPILEYRLAGSWSWYLGYNIENNELIDLKADVPDPDFERKVHFIASIPVGVKFDNRDNPLNPTRGTYFSLEMELSHGTLGSEVNFFRPTAEVRQVIGLGGKWYLAGRAKGGFCHALGGTDRVPLIRRFFLGGADSVRGYPYQKLGPLDSGGKPLGGIAAVEGSVELRFPIISDLGGVLFLDAGNTWGTVELPIPKIYYAAGVGLRYHTPVGPLRVDIGYQLNPPPGDHLPLYQFFLTVGQAF